MAALHRRTSALAVVLVVTATQWGAATQSSHDASLFGEGVALTSLQGLGSIEKPVFVLYYTDGSSSHDIGSVAATWQELAAWAAAEALQSSAAAVRREVIGDGGQLPAPAQPTVECLSASGRTVQHRGSLALQDLKLFVAEECRGINLPVKAFSAIEKYSANPKVHDAAYGRMVQQLTTRNFKTRTRDRSAIVLTSSGMCALCKILRPSYNNLRKEPALSKVAVLHVEGDAAKDSPIGAHLGTAPTVLFLHSGEVTGRFDLKASKDTGAYAWELVAWAVRQQLLPQDCLERAKAAQQVPDTPQKPQKPSMTFQSLVPPFTEDSIAHQAEGEGLLVVYHTAACWQCGSVMIQTWRQLADGHLPLARSEMMFPSRSPQRLGAHHCTAPFCILYWRGGRPIKRFTGTIDSASLWQFWRAMSAVDGTEAGALARRLELGGEGDGNGSRAPDGKLQREAELVQQLKEKELLQQQRRKRVPHSEL